MAAGAPEGNTNAEKWTLELAIELFDKCLAVALDKEKDCNDFIGEVAQECGTSHGVLGYLNEKYKELESKYLEIKQACEANCFRNGKKGKIVPSLAIMNLKSNHGWTDRQEIKHEVSQGFLNIDPLADDPSNNSTTKDSPA